MEFMNTALSDDERLYRAVAPDNMYWKQEGRISSAVFKDSNGASTDREMGREVSACIEHLLSHLDIGGSVVSVTVQQCTEVGAQAEYDPKEENEYHSLIVNSQESRQLTDGKAKRLAKVARYDHLDSYGEKMYKQSEQKEPPPSISS